MKKAQAEVVTYIMLTLIIVIVSTTAFFWAKGLLDKNIDVSEMQQVEIQMKELAKAIKEVANDRGQRSVDFDIKEGWLFLEDNRTVTYLAYLKLPDDFSVLKNNSVMLDGNNSDWGPCLNMSGTGTVESFGRLGYDEPYCLKESGSLKIELKFPILNNTLDATGKCYVIQLDSGTNTKVGRGSHSVLLTFMNTTTTTTTGCPGMIRQFVKMEME